MNALIVRFVGPVRRPGPQREVQIERAGIVSVGDLLGRLGYDAVERSRLTVLLDGVRADVDTPVEGAAVADVLLLVGGG